MKKALALSMALAMSAAMLAGCGGSASDSTSASGAASSADSAASGTPTVSFMIPDFTGHVLSNEHSDEVIAKYEAYTGTHVEWRTEANDTYSEKFGLTLMDKDNMPMILTATKTLDQNANAADAAKRGAFWDLTEYLQDSEAYPNLSQISPDVLKGLTVDGQIIGIPRSRAIGRNGLGYRTDWAEAVGITEAPKTVEDVKACLHFLDKMCDPEMMALADYGLKDICYDINADGKIVPNGKYDTTNCPHAGLNQAVPYVPYLTEQNPDYQLEKADYQLAYEESIANNVQYAVFNPALGYLTQSDTYAECGSDLVQILDDARTQYICGQIDEAGLQAAFDQWNARGGTQVIEEVNALYAADKA